MTRKQQKQKAEQRAALGDEKAILLLIKLLESRKRLESLKQQEAKKKEHFVNYNGEINEKLKRHIKRIWMEKIGKLDFDEKG